jgi:hypothetical protein
LALVVHARADLSPELEQPLFDEHRHLAGEWKGLLTLREHPNVPLISILGRGELGARVLITRGSFPALPQHGALPFNLGRPRLLPLLETLDAAHHHAAIVIDDVEQAREQELERVITLVCRLPIDKPRDGFDRVLKRHATAREDWDELSDVHAVAPSREIVDGWAVPHLDRSQPRHLALDTRPIRVGRIRGLRRQSAKRGDANGDQNNDRDRMSDVVLLCQNFATTTPQG